MDEFEIIADFFAPLATASGAFGLKDDAAAIAARPGFDLIVTADQIAEDTDFFAHDPAGTIAQKALRVNLSDLAAKGAAPEFYLLVVALPAGVTAEWLTAFAAGLAADQKRYGVSLLGGDTARTQGPLSITVTAFGFVTQGGMIGRSGARPGEGVYVTGTIGDSAGGLAIFKREKHSLGEEPRNYLTDRFRLPDPPVDFGKSLRGTVSASVDVSDGLLADLGHIAKASGVRVEIDAEKIPRSAALRALWGDGIDAIRRVATAGDDYQIAFTADP
ncbi:MAG TPA: thiamine-phosphate kinase, partial [Rhizomicrobium sp.]|nr:thiamine-phosphate kinase [Rhizomicrobium sp.]